MNFRKILIFLAVSALAVGLVIWLWPNPLGLSCSLFVLGVVKHQLAPVKKELTLFVLSGFFGTTVESIVMLSGVWTYAETHLLNIPLWLPFLWGVAGTGGITFYQGITEES